MAIFWANYVDNSKLNYTLTYSIDYKFAGNSQSNSQSSCCILCQSEAAIHFMMDIVNRRYIIIVQSYMNLDNRVFSKYSLVNGQCAVLPAAAPVRSAMLDCLNGACPSLPVSVPTLSQSQKVGY